MGVVGDKIYLGDTPVSLVKDNYFVLANPYSEQPAGPTYQFRNDPYSASLVYAVPMSEFSSLGMSNWYDNVAADIRGTGTSLPMVPTGSNYYPSSSYIVSYGGNDWSTEGYTDSGYRGLSTTYGTATTSNPVFGSSNFVVEGWFLLPSTSIGALYQAVVFGYNSGDNLLMDIRTQNNLLRYYVNTGGGAVGGGTAFTWAADTWYHIAFVRSGTNFYSYVNGTRYHNFSASGAISLGGSLDYWRIMGYNNNNDTVPILNQDFRMYIGTDKGYNTSTITPPQSIVELV